MTREELFNIWAPQGGTWSLWTRPILFAQMPDSALAAPISGEVDGRQAIDNILDLTVKDLLSREPHASGHTVVVVDLPGKESTQTGLALADQGYRPVPLYNGCTGPKEVILQGAIIEALRAGGTQLALKTLTNGPPAFLLDSKRMSPSWIPIQPGDFDNRWQVFPQDFPSAAFLVGRGFTRALLLQRNSRQPQEDLTHVLRRWQEAGLSIEVKDLADTDPPGPVMMNRPRLYRSLWQRVLAILQLRRNPKGGFGQEVPKPSSHG
jgi:hypothetical protein